MSKKFLSPIKLAQGATNPAAGSEGELFWNTTDLKVYIHNGTAWTPSAGGFTISDTAPTSPAPRHGDSWLDSSEGCLYAFYDDGLADSRTNLIGNPGFEVDTTGWSSTDFLDRDLGGAWGKYDGIASLFFTTDVQYQKVTVQPSSPYTLSVYGMTDYGSTALTLQTIFYDSSNTIISTASSTGLSFPSYGTWERKSFTATSPANAAYAKIGLIHEAANIDNVLFEQSASLGTYIVGTVAGTGPTGQWIQIQTTSAINSELANRMAAAESDVTTLQTQVSGFEADVISLDSRTDSLEARATAIEGRATVLEARELSPNYIINGGFDIWQRGTTSTQTDTYGSADRWVIKGTLSRQTFAPGSTGLSSSTYYANLTWPAATFYYLSQRIENVALLSGKTITVSFLAKSSISNPIYIRLLRSYGTGGSAPDELVFGSGSTATVTTTTSWQRYSYTYTIPSLAGKTVGPPETSYLEVGFYGVRSGATAGNFDIADIMVETGSVATSFRRNANSPQGELAACQRYFFRWNGATGDSLTNVNFWMTNRAWGVFNLPVTMRATPSVSWGGSGWHVLASNSNIALSDIGASNSTPNTVGVDAYTASGGTQNISGTVRVNVISGTSYMSVSAEL